MTDWIRRYYLLARHVAGWSKDPSTRVGAVIVGKQPGKIALGYNGFPRGIADTEDRLSDRTKKYSMIQHAERNALDNASFDLEGATLVATMFPCSECVKSIIQRGITTVASPPPLDRSPWREDADLSKSMLQEAGVTLLTVDG